MKKYALLSLLFSLALLTACDNEIDLTAEWEGIPIVYGLLDAQDTAHYIRVEKAFLDPETSAFVIAQRPDSLYYGEDEVNVYLVDVDKDESYALERVNGNEDGYVRDTGIFAHEPNYLYKIRDDELNIKTGRAYRFELHRGNGKDVVTGETVVLDTLNMRFLGERLSFKPERLTRIRWDENENAYFYSLALNINYEEKGPSTGLEFVEKQITWQLSTLEEDPIIEVDGEQFFAFLSNSLEADAMITREFEDIDLYLDAGGQGLDEYIRVALANTGVTGSQEIPNYSNLSEGFGVFSSVTRKRIYGLGLTNETLDSLRNGSLTADLNF